MLYNRVNVIRIVFVFCVLLIIIRLFKIQIIENKYSIYAQKNSIRIVTKYSARGILYDRNRKILSENIPTYDLGMDVQNTLQFDTLLLANILSGTKADFEQNIKKARRNRIGNLAIVEKQLSVSTFARLQEHLFNFPSFFSNTRIARYYPDSTAALFLGYISEINQADYATGQYELGDYIGVSGVEKYYDQYLKGKNGRTYYLVDANNHIQERYNDGDTDVKSVPGQSLMLSIDKDLQIFGERLMKNKIGSIVAIEPSTGDILCFVSSPSYEPNSLVGRNRTIFNKLKNDTLKPLLNRPIQAQYPPGSIFKAINALFALKEGVITPQTRNTCSGFYRYGRGRILRCTHIHGNVDLYAAISRSCNAYFCMVFDNIFKNPKYATPQEAYDSWHQFVQSFGIGNKLNIDMDFEAAGFLPRSNYFDKLYRGRWNSHTIISMAIGQGEILMTPLQMANAMACLANNMTYYTPHSLKANEEANRELLDKFVTKQTINIDTQFVKPVIEGMAGVVNDIEGTARWYKIDNIEMVGKTGTAENPHGKDHSIFVAFAPKENPKIAIAVVVENAGYGSSWAAPISSLMIEKYLKREVNTNRWFVHRILSSDLISKSQTKTINQ